MKKIIIIGAKGNLGRALAKVYQDQAPLLWDRDEIDITDEEQVQNLITSHAPNLVYNCAAYNAVDKAEEDAATADEVNGAAVGNLARACSGIGATLVHFGSNYVFDGLKSEGYTEDDRPNPISAYGRSKRLGEIELAQNTDNYYLIRTAWLYGESDGTGKKSFIQIMLDLAAADKPIKAVNDEYGNPTYTLDLAQAVMSLVEQNKPFGIYHLTNAGMASWFDWAKEIFDVKQLSPQLLAIKSEDLKRPAQRPRYGILNNTKYIELRPWTEALKEFLHED